MRVYYLDSSAWVKRYLTEPGSTWVRDLFDSKEPLACSPAGYVEVAAAIARHKGVRQIPPNRKIILRRDFLADWHEMLHAPLTAEVIQVAADLALDEKLRGAEALHLASAYALKTSLAQRSVNLTLVTADPELLAAAHRRHLEVLDPAKPF
jgi:predicted nucleic acid-binding protein